MYMVKYKVTGYGDQVFVAGPYSADEAEYHRSDIMSFDAIHSVTVEEETSWERMARGIGPDGERGIQKL